MADVSKIRVDGVDYDVKDTTARTEITPIERGGTGASNLYSARANLSVVPWAIITADTLSTFWESISNVGNNYIGCVAFRAKDTSGWMAMSTSNLWYNGLAFWQNSPESTNDVCGTILTRANGSTYQSIYKGIVSGNSTNGYTVTWSKLQETSV